MDDFAAVADKYMKIICDYTVQKYVDEIDSSFDECPHKTDFEDPDMAFKQVTLWFLCERKNSSGKTLLEELAKKFIDDPRVVSQLLQMTDITNDTFVVDEPPDYNGIMRITSQSTSKTFAVEVAGKGHNMFPTGRVFVGLIHPWREDGTYRTTGIIRLKRTAEEIFQAYGVITSDMTDKLLDQMHAEMQKNAESIGMNPRSRTRTLLKKIPAQWIDGMCHSLHVPKKRNKKEKIEAIASVLTTEDDLRDIMSGLDKSDVDVLRLVLEKNCHVSHASLCRMVGNDDTTWSWTGEPHSAVGRLRRRGLLIVGEMKKSSGTRRTVMIPADVVVPLKSCIGI